MTGTITRDEYQKYLKTKDKMSMTNAETQTEQGTPIPKTSSKTEDSISSTSTTTDDETISSEDSDTSSSTDDSKDTEDSDDTEREEYNPTRKRKTNEKENSALETAREFFKQLKKQRYVNKDDEVYYNGLDVQERTRLKKVEDDLYQLECNKIPLRFKIITSNIDDKLKSLCLKKIDQLDNMQYYSDEYYKLLQWVESVSKLPIGKYKELPITSNEDVETISSFLTATRDKLDDNVYGHKDTKEHIIRLLAKWISNKDAKGLVIGLEGPMGTGKTSLCLEICNALGLPSGFISLGGLSSSEYLVGHSYTYEGSRWGKIAEILMQAEYSNPVIFFDELDKVSTSRYGEEIVNTLIHITDVTQNHNFRDKYFSELSLDLSKCIIIFSYNNGDLINPILKDRMVTVKASGYTLQDKIEISKKHMIPKILKEYAFNDTDIVFSDDVLKHIIQITDDEKGVRKLKRSLEDIISQVNVFRLLKQKIAPTDKDFIKFPLIITENIAKKLIPKKNEKDSFPNMMYI